MRIQLGHLNDLSLRNKQLCLGSGLSAVDQPLRGYLFVLGSGQLRTVYVDNLSDVIAEDRLRGQPL